MIGMGLITEKVMVKWHSSNRKYYEEKGYEFTGYRKPFYVNVNDLNKYSKIYVKCECDNCGKDLLWQYADYVKQVKDDGSTCRFEICSYRPELLEDFVQLIVVSVLLLYMDIKNEIRIIF